MVGAVAEKSTGAFVAVEQLRSCPWCGGADFRARWTSFDRLHLVSRQQFSYQLCHSCGIVFQSPRPVETEIHRFYPDHYGPYGQGGRASAPGRASWGRRLLTWPWRKFFRGFAALTDRVFPRSFERRYFAHYQPSAPGQTLLDFGCGSDQFLNIARGLRWDTLGMDFNSQAVEKARASGHRSMVCTDEAWDEVADESCHFIRLSHVLEHLYHPRALLRRFASKMALGGTLHLALPNPRCLSARVFGSRWFSLDCPRHIMLYTVAFLKRELPDHGFRVTDVLHEPVTKDFARSYAYRQLDRGRIRHEQIDGFMHHRLLNDAVAVPIRILAGLGVGERIHVFASKI